MATQGFTPAELKVAAERAFAPSNAAGYVAPSSTSSGGSSANIVNSSTGQKGYQVPNAPIPVGWSAITPSDLTPTTTPNLNISNPHDNVNYNPMATVSGINAGLKISTDANGKYTFTSENPEGDQFVGLLNKLQQTPDQYTAYQNSPEKLAMDTAHTELQNHINELNTITAEANAQKIATIGQGRGIPTDILNNQQAQIDRNTAIRVLPIQAKIAAAQGNFDYAKTIFDTAFKLKMEDATNKVNFNNKLIDAVIGYADKQQTKQLEAIKTQNATNLSLYNSLVNDIRAEANKATDNKQMTIASSLNSLVNLMNPADKNFMQVYSSVQSTFAELSGKIVPKVTVSENAVNQPLSILDIQRYNDYAPNAGVIAGDTQAQADAKVKAISTPEGKAMSIISQAKNTDTYEQVVKDINNATPQELATKGLTDKNTALLAAQKVYGITTTSETPKTTTTTNEQSLVSKIYDFIFPFDKGYVK